MLLPGQSGILKIKDDPGYYFKRVLLSPWAAGSGLALELPVTIRATPVYTLTD
jgi:hypothetical protein